MDGRGVRISLIYYTYVSAIPQPSTTQTRTASATGSSSSCVRISELTIDGRPSEGIECPEHYDTQLQGRLVWHFQKCTAGGWRGRIHANCVLHFGAASFSINIQKPCLPLANASLCVSHTKLTSRPMCGFNSASPTSEQVMPPLQLSGTIENLC